MLVLDFKIRALLFEGQNSCKAGENVISPISVVQTQQFFLLLADQMQGLDPALCTSCCHGDSCFPNTGGRSGIVTSVIHSGHSSCCFWDQAGHGVKPGSVSLTAGGSEKLVQSTLPLPLFAPMKKKKGSQAGFHMYAF